MEKPSCFIALVDKVYDACNEMTALMDALERKENECNMLFAEVDALKRKVASLESIQQDALAMMDDCVAECHRYVFLADARTASAKAETKNWYRRACEQSDARMEAIMRVTPKKHDTPDAAPLGDTTNVFRACMKKD